MPGRQEEGSLSLGAVPRVWLGAWEEGIQKSAASGGSVQHNQAGVPAGRFEIKNKTKHQVFVPSGQADPLAQRQADTLGKRQLRGGLLHSQEASVGVVPLPHSPPGTVMAVVCPLTGSQPPPRGLRPSLSPWGALLKVWKDEFQNLKCFSLPPELKAQVFRVQGERVLGDWMSSETRPSSQNQVLELGFKLFGLVGAWGSVLDRLPCFPPPSCVVSNCKQTLHSSVKEETPPFGDFTAVVVPLFLQTWKK